jgi:16S rRNA (cytidine1402-2'-O)-methyltransferase
VTIPGVSALATLASVSGIDMQKFVFLGFPPHKKGRKTFFERVAISEIPVLYYDSPHRVVKNLTLLQEKKLDAQVIVGRELTKKFEEIIRGGISEVVGYFAQYTERVKGEFVVIVHSSRENA